MYRRRVLGGLREYRSGIDRKRGREADGVVLWD